MGYTRATPTDWTKYKTSTSTKSDAEIFTSTAVCTEMDPMGVTMREARDSDANPESTAVIIGCDVTGSMGELAKLLVREGMATLFTELLDRKPVTDPAILAMAIGDYTQCDRSPFQVGQFESDTTASEWLEKVHIERGGGGNRFESYDMPYYFAAFHTSIDCFEKRNKKGYIFTMGDEYPSPGTTIDGIKQVLDPEGDGLQVDMPFKDVLEAAMKMYHCYHLIIAEGSAARYSPDVTKDKWVNLMGQNAIWLDDWKAMPETIVSLIEVTEGRDKEEVAASWSGDTALVVANAIKDLDPAKAYEDAMGLVRL